jgi:hypothetical protein
MVWEEFVQVLSRVAYHAGICMFYGIGLSLGPTLLSSRLLG